jgi:hypothetical protein
MARSVDSDKHDHLVRVFYFCMRSELVFRTGVKRNLLLAEIVLGYHWEEASELSMRIEPLVPFCAIVRN